ncbi:hypothetical protein HVPorG_04969 (plasmid) [Roseomonas mucosa]|nr:hypothetical protein HVPorG_04969 [Roseomonas mucosa]
MTVICLPCSEVQAFLREIPHQRAHEGAHPTRETHGRRILPRPGIALRLSMRIPVEEDVSRAVLGSGPIDVSVAI